MIHLLLFFIDIFDCYNQPVFFIILDCSGCHRQLVTYWAATAAAVNQKHLISSSGQPKQQVQEGNQAKPFLQTSYQHLLENCSGGKPIIDRLTLWWSRGALDVMCIGWYSSIVHWIHLMDWEHLW